MILFRQYACTHIYLWFQLTEDSKLNWRISSFSLDISVSLEPSISSSESVFLKSLSMKLASWSFKANCRLTKKHNPSTKLTRAKNKMPMSTVKFSHSSESSNYILSDIYHTHRAIALWILETKSITFVNLVYHLFIWKSISAAETKHKNNSNKILPLRIELDKKHFFSTSHTQPGTLHTSIILLQ